MGRKLSPRKQRHQRVRKKVFGTSERPRLNVFRSANHIYAQLIDDTTHRTLAAASTLEEAVKAEVGYGGNKEAARVVGRLIAEKAKSRYYYCRIRPWRLSLPRAGQRIGRGGSLPVWNSRQGREQLEIWY